MGSMKRLGRVLESLSDGEHYLFSIRDFYAVFPDLSYSALKALLSRAEKSELLKRVCRGIYLNPRVSYPKGLLLYHAAAKLRAGYFTYISLETALSDAGVISQVLQNWITLMSSGRTYTYSCGDFGTIECVHTKKEPKAIAGELHYDSRCRLWRASVEQAIQDMRDLRRPMDLIDWSAVKKNGSL